MIACPLCRAPGATRVFRVRDYEYGVPGEWDVAHCAACGLYFQDPLPHPSELRLLPPTYSAYNPDPVINAAFRVVYRQDARQIARLLPQAGAVLDIGCGSGAALLELQKLGNWRLHGLEIDPGAAEMARQAGLDVRTGTLDDVQYPSDQFDLIRLGHVIEHVIDPNDALAKIYRMLKPGGILFGETPNTDCLDFKLFQRYWGALHMPRHITLFNDQNLLWALNRAGFEDVKFGWHQRSVGWSAGIQNWLKTSLA